MLEKIRILMGAEHTQRTRRALLGAVGARAVERLEASLEDEKETNPLLEGVLAIVEALRWGQIECRAELVEVLKTPPPPGSRAAK